MEIYKDFDFIDENKTSIFLGNTEYMKEEIDQVISLIEETVQWAMSSPYSTCFSNVYIFLSDSPAMPMEFVDCDQTSKKLYVFLNVLSLIWDYKHEIVYRKAIFKNAWEQIDLDTYVRFFVLHELGHIVHSELLTPYAIHSLEKYERYIAKYTPLYRKLDEKFEAEKMIEWNDNRKERVQREYRKLPHEKFADAFAFNCLNKIKKDD